MVDIVAQDLKTSPDQLIPMAQIRISFDFKNFTDHHTIVHRNNRIRDTIFICSVSCRAGDSGRIDPPIPICFDPLFRQV